MASIIFRIIKLVVVYSFAIFYGSLVSLYLFGKLCQLRLGFFKKREGTKGMSIMIHNSINLIRLSFSCHTYVVIPLVFAETFIAMWAECSCKGRGERGGG